MLRTTAGVLAAGLLFVGFLHSLEVIAPARAVDGKQSRPGVLSERNNCSPPSFKCVHVHYRMGFV